MAVTESNDVSPEFRAMEEKLSKLIEPMVSGSVLFWMLKNENLFTDPVRAEEVYDRSVAQLFKRHGLAIEELDELNSRPEIVSGVTREMLIGPDRGRQWD